MLPKNSLSIIHWRLHCMILKLPQKHHERDNIIQGFLLRLCALLYTSQVTMVPWLYYITPQRVFTLCDNTIEVSLSINQNYLIKSKLFPCLDRTLYKDKPILCNTKTWQMGFCKYWEIHNKYQLLMVRFIIVIHPPWYGEI